MQIYCSVSSCCRNLKYSTLQSSGRGFMTCMCHSDELYLNDRNEIGTVQKN